MATYRITSWHHLTRTRIDECYQLPKAMNLGWLACYDALEAEGQLAGLRAHQAWTAFDDHGEVERAIKSEGYVSVALTNGRFVTVTRL